MPEAEVTTLSDVLDRVEAAGRDARDDKSHVRVANIVERLGERSFSALLLAPALLTVSPLSGIPGVPTTAALIMATIIVQMLVGRDHLWLPGVLCRRKVPARRVVQAMEFMKKPVGWIEPWLKPRLTALTHRPASYLALLVCLSITITMPPLEALPMVASLSGAAISLFAAGLLLRDGLLMLFGYSVVGAGGFAVWRLLAG